MMREELLHFIWQFRYYNHRELTTEAGAELCINYPGDPNTNQGPDFKNARITIGGILREGAVELHFRTSDWLRHGHTGKPHYRDIILHVVWENDTADPPAGIPILVLRDRTPKSLLPRYEQFMTSQYFVPCERLLTAAENFVGPAKDFTGPAKDFTGPAKDFTGPAKDFTGPAKDFTGPASTRSGSFGPFAFARAQSGSFGPFAFARAQSSSSVTFASPGYPSPGSSRSPGTSFLGYHWQTLRGTLICRRLANRTAFIRTLLDEKSPHWEQTIFWLITRSLGQPVNTDAFLAIARSLPFTFLLRRRADPARLEALFLDQAARLDQPLSFHRMRPAHSPYTRLRQLAALLSNHTGWFTLLLESDHPAALLETLDVQGLGAATKQSILINAHIPLLYAYGTLRQEPQQRDKALHWLQETPPENNSVIRHWRKLGMPARSAADTQALLELRKSYCLEKKCLDCGIGQALLTTSAPEPASLPLTPDPPSPANENLPSLPGRDGYCT